MDKRDAQRKNPRRSYQAPPVVVRRRRDSERSTPPSGDDDASVVGFVLVVLVVGGLAYACQGAFSEEPKPSPDDLAPDTTNAANAANTISTLDQMSTVLSFSYSPDGSLLASSGEGSVYLWNPSSSEEVARFDIAGPGGPVAFSPDGRLLAGGDGATVRIWDVASREVVEVLSYKGRVDRVAFSPDGGLLAAGGIDGPVRLWDTSTRRMVADLGSTVETQSFVFSADGRLLATVDHDLHVWDLASLREISSANFDHGPLGFWPDGRLIAHTDLDGLELREVATGVKTAELDHHGIQAMATSPDGRIVATGAQGSVKLWDASTLRELVQLPYADYVDSLDFSPDGGLLAVGGNDGVHLFDTATHRLVDSRAGSPLAVDFSPDGTQLAARSTSSSLALWDIPRP